MLTALEAAEYCGRGTAPPPIPPKRVKPGKQGMRYDVRDLDRWLDSLDEAQQDEHSATEWLDRLDHAQHQGARG
jgi:hypothetical protein